MSKPSNGKAGRQLRVQRVVSGQILACNKLDNVRRRAERAGNGQTCPASRHVELMATVLAAKKKYPMFDEEPEHCAMSMYSVLESLWKARAEIKRLTANDPDQRPGRQPKA